MRNFNNAKQVLFDSTKAAFKVEVQAQFTRSNNMGRIHTISLC
jgi:hypothetical protein